MDTHTSAIEELDASHNMTTMANTIQGDTEVQHDLGRAGEQGLVAPATNTTTTTTTTRRTSTTPTSLTTTTSTCHTTSTTLTTSTTSVIHTTSTTHTTKTTTLRNHVSVIDRLPLELAMMVMEYLVEYNLAPGKYSEYIEDPAVYPSNNWVKLTQESCSTILNACLSCWKLYKASYSSFATLLGDRKFRYTKTGVDDLQHIAQQTALVPHISTLTIACGGFRVDDIHDIREAMVKLEARDQDRLLEAYVQCAAWQGHNLLDYQSKLASLFRMFPKLSTIRIDACDVPMYLGGWMEVGDPQMLHLHGCLYRKMNPKPYWHERAEMYRPNAIQASHIMHALVLAETTVRDLRIWGVDWKYYDDLNIKSFNLHTLRLDGCYYDYHKRPPVDVSSSTRLDSVLPLLPNLPDLSLQANEDEGLLPLSDHVQALASHVNLRRLCFSGDWDIHVSELATLVKAHSHSLGCLILERVWMHDSVNTTLDTVFRAGGGRLRLVRGVGVFSLSERDPSCEESTIYDFTITDEDLVRLKSPEDWQEELQVVG